jgi:nitrogenase molybdenum-iron protein alpha chain
MGHTDNKVVPRREDRLRVGNAFGGNICGLLEKSKSGCLVNSNRTFCQTCNCQMSLTLSMLLTFPDTVILMHGPIGCGSSSHSADTYYRSGQIQRGLKPGALLWGSSNLEEQDIINGGEKKLEDAIIEIDKNLRPQVIAVVTSCAPGIIGDDVNEVIGRTQKYVNATIMPVLCEGFKTKISATAYDAVYHGIARHLNLLPDEEENGIYEDQIEEIKRNYKKSKTINIFNVFSIGRPDEIELKRLLNALGYEVNFYPNFAHPETYKQITEAVLNVSLCPTHDDYFLEFMKERFNIPYILKNMPIGIANTGEWLLDIAEVLGVKKETERIIEIEVKELERELKYFRKKISGKIFLISGGEMRVAATAMLIKEIGGEVAGIRGHHYDQFGDYTYAKLLNVNSEMEVNIATTQIFELINLVNKLKPDLYLGHSGSNIWSSKLGVPSLPIFNQNQFYLGYKGVYEVAKRCARLLENNAFQTHLKENTCLPYKSSWLENNPFAYIKE